jgi:hypothetical protein
MIDSIQWRGLVQPEIGIHGDEPFSMRRRGEVILEKESFADTARRE